MLSLKKNLLAEPFSHIYVERELVGDRRTQEILHRFAHARVIEIGHYKDVFCRPRQHTALQHASQALILARKTGSLIYPGSPVCQNFGNHHFYYTSLCMNCVFDCQYCYLRGMYPSGHLVLFMNLEDYIAELETLLLEHPVYLCISYDTELCALENLHGYVHAFARETERHENLTIEVRTKTSCTQLLRSLPGSSRVIFAFTLSPEEVIRYEKKTPSLQARLEAVLEGLDLGHTIRLCFDPMIHVPEWRKAYSRMMETIVKELGEERLRHVFDFSIGSFRISQDYLRALRKSTDSAVVQYPFVNVDGFYQYPPETAEEMENTMTGLLLPYAGRDRIFRWREQI